jgi:hypothetical protein
MADQVLDNAVRNFLSLTSAASSDVSAGATEVSKKYVEAEKAANTAKDSAVALQRQKDLTDLEAQEATRRAASAAGVDPSKAADAVFETLGQLKKSNDAIRETAAIVAQKSAVRPHVDGIGAWISARASVGWDKQRLEGQLVESKILSGQLAEMNQAIQQSAQTYQALKEPITHAQIQDRANIVAADATSKVAELAAKGFQFNATAIGAIEKASHDQMTALFNLKSAKNADVQLELSIHNSRRQDEQFDWMKAEREIANKAKLEGKRVDEKTLYYINLSRKNIGAPEMSAEEFSFQNKLSAKSGELAYHLENGMRIDSTNIPMVGSTPSEALNAVKTFASNIPDIQQETLALIQQTEEQVRSKNKLVDYKKEPKLLEDAVSKQIKNNMETAYQKIRPGSVLDVGDLRSYIGTTAGPGIGDLFKLPLTQKVLLPLADAGQPLADMKQILTLTNAAVRKGEITSSEAASGLSQIMRKASSINILARGLNGKFGFIVPENGAKYNVQVGGMFNSQIIDMNNPTSLNGYFARSMMVDSSIGRQMNAQDEAMRARFGQ